MARIVKEHEVRRKELLDISMNLFIKNGYEETTVVDIITEAGIAKGTFYHYFRSKDEILIEIADDMMSDINGMMEDIINNENLNAVQKIIYTFKASQEYRKSHNGQERIIDHIHDPKNQKLHHELEVKNVPIFEDFFERLIQQGISEGLFETEYPKEAAMSIVAIMNAIGHGARKEQVKDKQELIRLLFAFLNLMERILGTDKGTFNEVFKSIEVSE